MKELTNSKLDELVLHKEEELSKINDRLSDASISDETYRQLLKTKNELVADIQAAKIELSTRNHNSHKSFERSLNESKI